MTNITMGRKMKFHLSKSMWVQCLVISAMLILLNSCKPYLEASNDWAKQAESGGSAVDQSERDFVNFALFWDDISHPSWGFLSAADRNKVYDEDADKKQDMINFTLGAGLEFVGKGGKYPGDGGTVALNYLEVPIYGTGNYIIDSKSKVFVGIGPYFAYGIGGKVKSGNFESSSFGENNGGYKRFDAGLTFMGGYQFQKFRLSLNYDLGLVNTAYASEDITSKGRSFGISVGYSLASLFEKKK
jgi:Outer membrane protein beta-barrel domain